MGELGLTAAPIPESAGGAGFSYLGWSLAMLVVIVLVGATAGRLVVLHARKDQVHALANFLREKGADSVSVGRLDYVFARDTPLYAKL